MAPKRPLTRKTLLNAAGALAGLTFAILGILLVTRILSFEPELPPIDHAVAVEATIIGQRIERDPARIGREHDQPLDHHIVHYAFFDDSHTLFSADAEVSPIYYQAHPPGRLVTAYYFRGRPQVSVLEDPAGLAVTGSRYGQLIGGILLLIGGIAVARLSHQALIAHRGYGWV